MSDKNSKQIRSKVTSDGNIEISIATVEKPIPSDNEVLIKVEAAPINPSDLGLLLSFAADLSTINISGSGDETVTSMKINPSLMNAMKPRLDQSMPVGNEGAGIIEGAGENQQDLIGNVVGSAGGARCDDVPPPRCDDGIAGSEGLQRREPCVQGAQVEVGPGRTEKPSACRDRRAEGHQHRVLACNGIGVRLDRHQPVVFLRLKVPRTFRLGVVPGADLTLDFTAAPVPVGQEAAARVR